MTLKEYYRESKNIKLKEGNNMKKILLRVPLAERIGLVLAILAGITNQLTNQFVVDLVDRGLIYLSKEGGAYVTVAFAVWVVWYIARNIYRSGQNNVPSKSDKTEKAGKYIATN